MGYTLTYRMGFTDVHTVTPAKWDMQLLKKDGPLVDVIELNAGVTGIILDKSTGNDDKFSPIIGTSATIGYVYDTGMPKPDIFINIEEDDWLMIISKDGVVEFKGFVKPDSNSYPLLFPPFEFKVNATDYFQVMKAIPINLDDDVLFLYDYIPLGEFFRRTLFDAVAYDDVVLNIVFTRRPGSLTAGQTIADSLYIHTDLFYDFNKGALPVYDCLTDFLISVGSRLFYSSGAYWLMRVEDMDQDVFSYLQITPNDLSGQIITDANVLRNLGTSDPQYDVYYLERSQLISIDPALKKQEFTYKLKAINRLVNFDWRYFDGSNFAGWGSHNPGLVLTRNGSGTLDEPYRARFSGGGDSSVGQFIGQLWQVTPGQHVEINLKVFTYYTTGVRVNVFLQPITTGDSYYLSGTDWIKAGATPTTDQEMLVAGDKKTRFGSVSVVTKPFPNGAPNYNLFMNFIGPKAADPDPEDPIPPGTSPYNEVYPAFLRIFNNPYNEMDTKIENSRVCSYIPDSLTPTVLDTNDDALSNTVYFKEDGIYKKLPPDDWRSMKNTELLNHSLDEVMARDRLAAACDPVYNLGGSLYSNSMAFHHVVNCPDMGKRFMILRDRYTTQQCRHEVLISEIKAEGSGVGGYTVTPKEDTNV
jgi:hypothetical protein